MARREVAVDLILRAAQYLREGRAVLTQTVATTRAVDELGDKADATGRDMDQLAAQTELAKHQVDDLGDKARTTAASMALLHSRITASRAAVRGLAMDFATTDDAGAASALSREQAKLRRLERAAKVLTPEPGGGGLFGAIPNIGGVPGPAIAGGAAAVAALAPFLSGVIASAVVGGVGTGGLVGGIVLAEQDVRVHDAFKDLGRTMFAEISDATAPLVGPLVNAANMFGEAWKAELPGLQADFKTLAQTVAPISEGLAGFIHQLHPGLSAAFKASVPIAEQFGKEFERFGAATTDFLESMADSAPGARIALHDLFTVTDEGLRQLGQGIEILTETYEVTRKLGLVAPPEWLLQASKGALPAYLDVLGQARQSYDLYTGGVQASVKTFDSAATATEKLKRQQVEQADASLKAEKAIERNTKAVRDYFDTVMGTLDAAEHYEAAIDDLTQSVKDNGKTLDIHTEKGRANRDALEEVARATKDMYDAGLLSYDAYQDQIKALETYATKLGLSRDAVLKLLGAVELLPSEVITNVIIKVDDLLARRWRLFGEEPTKSPQQGKGGADVILGGGHGIGSTSHQTFIDLPGRDVGGPAYAGQSYLIGGQTGPPEVLTMGGQPGFITPVEPGVPIDYGRLASAIVAAFHDSPIELDGQAVTRTVTRQQGADAYARPGI